MSLVCNLLFRSGLTLSFVAAVLSAPVQAANDIPISGEFNLINHEGVKVTQASYDGYYRLVFFGFTHCPDICPTTMATIGTALSELGAQSTAIKPLFISVDHERDTPERLKNYVSYFHPSVDGLSGTEEQIGEAAKNFNTAFGKSSSEPGGDWYHSSYLYLMDRDGELLDLLSHAVTKELLVERLEALK